MTEPRIDSWHPRDRPPSCGKCGVPYRGTLSMPGLHPDELSHWRPQCECWKAEAPSHCSNCGQPVSTDRCSNCGNPWNAKACGPTHAIVAEERRKRAADVIPRAKVRELIVRAVLESLDLEDDEKPRYSQELTTRQWHDANRTVSERIADRLLSELEPLTPIDVGLPYNTPLPEKGREP